MTAATSVLRFFAWSYSRLSDWEACPLRSKFKHLMKIPDPGSPALARGSDVHDHVAKYLTGKVRSIAPEWKRHAKRIALLKSLKPSVEQQWGFDAAWNRSDWFGANTIARIVVDAAAIVEKKGRPKTLLIVDWKTGKKREGYADQLELYALAGFARYPDVATVETELHYLDQDPDETETRSFARTDLPTLKAKWAKRVRPMLADRKFPPNPGRACMWCPYSASKGGPCQF